MKLIVTGHAKHGKDTVCNLLCSMLGLRFMSSSRFTAERAVRPWLLARGVVYNSLDECYADRGSHRAEWFEAISEYNKLDPSKLGRELFAEYDIYCGLRSMREFYALRRDIDASIWVDSSKRVESEPRSSMSITQNVCDFTIDNNGPVGDLDLQVSWLVSGLLGHIGHRRAHRRFD